MTNWLDSGIEEWNERAQSWHNRSRSMWIAGSRKDIIPLLKKHLPEGATLLDIGCGDGTGTYLAAQEGFRATGIDASEEMIRYASKYKSANLSFHSLPMEEMAQLERQYDSAMCINALEWVENPFSAMKQIDRSVLDGGVICCAILGPTAAPRSHALSRLTDGRSICNTMMPWECKKLAQMIGWSLLEEVYVWKEEAKSLDTDELPPALKQALTFATIFVFKKKSSSAASSAD